GIAMTSPDTPIRVLVADDQKVVRDGLAVLLGLLDGIEVIGTAVDGADAVRQALTADPDVVLMDLNMPTVDGVEATRRLAEAGAPPRVDDGLTAREEEVLVEIAAGHSNDEIADRLFVSATTIKTHVNHLLAKTGCRDRAALVAYAYRTGRVSA